MTVLLRTEKSPEHPINLPRGRKTVLYEQTLPPWQVDTHIHIIWNVLKQDFRQRFMLYLCNVCKQYFNLSGAAIIKKQVILGKAQNASSLWLSE